MILAIPFPIAVGGSALFTILGVLLLIGSSLQAYNTLALSRRDATLPGHVEPGMSIVEGTARPLNGETLDVPGSDQERLAYEYRVQRDSHDKHEATEVESGHESVPFVLDGGGGEVVVHPEGADLRLKDGDDGELSRDTFVDEGTDVTNGSEIVLSKFDSIDPGETVTVAGRVETGEGRPTVADPVAPGTRVKVFDEGSDAAAQTQLRSTVSGALLAVGLVGVGVWGLSATVL